jgi:hypothetical protein
VFDNKRQTIMSALQTIYVKRTMLQLVKPMRLFTKRLFTATLRPSSFLRLGRREKRPCCFLKNTIHPISKTTHTRFVIVLTVSVFLTENKKVNAVTNNSTRQINQNQHKKFKDIFS